jgi:hypothetical protein
MGSLLFALMPLLAAQPIAAPMPKNILIQVVLYQGNPAAKDRQVISRPTLITTEGQQALVSMGQAVMLNPSVLHEGTKPTELKQFEAGITLKMLPTLRKDGRVLLRSTITTIELLDNSDERTQTKECTTHFDTICTLGERISVPLYYAMNEKPFTNRECWLELEVSEMALKKLEATGRVERVNGVLQTVPLGK